jgi:hypothetical protein
MELHDLSGDIEAQPEPAVVTGTMGLVESLEDPRTVLNRNPDAMIQDGDAQNRAADCLDRHRDLSSRWTELDGVVDQVVQHLLKRILSM